MDVATANPDSEESKLVDQVSQMTGMRPEFSRQCLEECQWNLEMALQAFRHVEEAGLLPEYAML